MTIIEGETDLCAACGFTLSWHAISGNDAKNARAYCPARPEFSYWRSRSRNYGYTVSSTTPWVRNIDTRGRPVDRSVVSPTFGAALIRAFQAAYFAPLAEARHEG